MIDCCKENTVSFSSKLNVLVKIFLQNWYISESIAKCFFSSSWIVPEKFWRRSLILIFLIFLFTKKHEIIKYMLMIFSWIYLLFIQLKAQGNCIKILTYDMPSFLRVLWNKLFKLTCYSNFRFWLFCSFAGEGRGGRRVHQSDESSGS